MRHELFKGEDASHERAHWLRLAVTWHVLVRSVRNIGIIGEDLFADDPGDWNRVTRLAVRKMRLVGNAGAVVNTASLIGLWPMPSAPVYAAAKAGVVNFLTLRPFRAARFGGP